VVLHHRRWRMALLGATAAGGVFVAAAWAALLTPQPVVTAKGRQILPSAVAGATYLAYSQSRPHHGNLYDVYVKPAGEPRYKVNRRGVGYAGGLDGTTLVWQSVRNGQSDLRLFDVAAHTGSVPSGVNTRRWEFWPTISGDWILYGQLWHRRPVNWRVILHNTNTAETRVLDERINRPHREVDPGQVNGDYATWESWNSRTNVANVFRYQISTQTSMKLPEPAGRSQYYASVTPDGTVYYVRSRLVGCGNHVVIRQYAGGVDTPLATLPLGSDVLTRTFAVDEGGGVTTVYFDRYQCSTGRTHIYKITVS
jgi:Tol biopolymer transport system component